MITPTFVGQRYKDTNTGNIWIANSTTPGDWTLEVQDMLVRWQPSNLKVGNMVMFSAWEDGASNLPGVTSLTLLAETLQDMDIEATPDLLTISAPNLTQLTGLNTGLYLDSLSVTTSLSFPLLVSAGGINIGSCPLLTSVDLSSFISTPGGSVALFSCGAITSFSLPAFVGTGTAMNITSCSSLATVNAPVWVPANGKTHNVKGCALNASTVNALLARAVANAGFVSGKIDLSGGTSAAPTGQGITDKNTLNARLAGLAVTN